MIRSNLRMILAQRGLKISDVSERTGISRTTLTALYHTTGKGIQFDTLDKLCDFLDVSPGDLFEHMAYEFRCNGIHDLGNSRSYQVNCDFLINKKIYKGNIVTDFSTEIDRDNPDAEYRVLVMIATKLYNKISEIPAYIIADNIVAEAFNYIFDPKYVGKIHAKPEFMLFDDDSLKDNKGEFITYEIDENQTK